MKDRFLRHGKTLFVLFLIGLSYYIFVIVTGIGIQCLFREITGLKCPGCGVTTMIICLSHLNFFGAFKANPMLFVTSPFLIGEIIYMFFIKQENKKNKVNDILLAIYAFSLIIFGVLRNIL